MLALLLPTAENKEVRKSQTHAELPQVERSMGADGPFQSRLVTSLVELVVKTVVEILQLLLTTAALLEELLLPSKLVILGVTNDEEDETFMRLVLRSKESGEKMVGFFTASCWIVACVKSARDDWIVDFVGLKGGHRHIFELLEVEVQMLIDDVVWCCNELLLVGMGGMPRMCLS